jgi:hypothetical protein
MTNESIDIEKILAAFKKSEAKAKAAYVGKRLRAYGKVLFVGESHGGAPMVMLHRLPNDFTTPSVYFPKKVKKQLAAIGSGDVLHFECQCDGVVGSMLMLNDARVLTDLPTTADGDVSMDALAKGMDTLIELVEGAGLDPSALTSIQSDMKREAKKQTGKPTKKSATKRPVKPAKKKSVKSTSPASNGKKGKKRR